MERLKIGYFADGPWSYHAFKKIIEDKSIEVKFIVPRSDTTDLTLKNYAIEYNIPFLTNVRINTDKFYEQASAFECDLFVSMSFDQIFKNNIINLPEKGTINCHAGKLPFYRGRNVLNWVLINDETEFGITVHFMDEGIDTGDIIMQEVYPITDKDDYNSLLEKAYFECGELLFQAIKQIQKDQVNRVKQNTIHPVGFYCGKRGNGDEIIDWSWSSRRVFNFIRAISSPGPMARTQLNQYEILINKAAMINDAPNYINKPGQLLSRTERGFLIKTGDSFVEIFDIKSELNLKVGDLLG